MALASTITERQSRRARTNNRARQTRAEARLEEIVKVSGIADEYAAVDRRGDLEIETRFAELYQLVNSEAERGAVARAFAAWQRDEQAEEAIVRGSVDESVDLLKQHNPLFIGEGR